MGNEKNVSRDTRLLFSTYGDEKMIQNTDVMADFSVNNYIGAKSLEYNLALIPRNMDMKINMLIKNEGRSCQDEFYLVKIW